MSLKSITKALYKEVKSHLDDINGVHSAKVPTSKKGTPATSSQLIKSKIASDKLKKKLHTLRKENSSTAFHGDVDPTTGSVTGATKLPDATAEMHAKGIKIDLKHRDKREAKNRHLEQVPSRIKKSLDEKHRVKHSFIDAKKYKDGESLDNIKKQSVYNKAKANKSFQKQQQLNKMSENARKEIGEKNRKKAKTETILKSLKK